MKIKRFKNSLAVVILLLPLLGIYNVFPQDCPSLLPGNLRDIGETGIAWGIELRTFLYGVNKYNQQSQSLQNKGYFFGAADILIQSEIGDNLFWLSEGAIRHWNNRSEYN